MAHLENFDCMYDSDSLTLYCTQSVCRCKKLTKSQDLHITAIWTHICHLICNCKA